MKLLVFSVRDEKAQTYSSPMVLPNKGMILREFSDMVIAGNNAISKHPEDYALYQIGEFDDFTGLVKSLPVPDLLGRASEFVNDPIKAK